MTEKHLAILRRHMVELIEIHAELGGDETGRSKISPRVLAAIGEVPRHHFVPAPFAALAYQDTPLPIGFDKTISQPYIVALMVDLLDIAPGDRVLEIGTGLGYQTAVLARLAAQIFSVEIVEEFANHAQGVVAALGIDNVRIRHGDGARGWLEHAPFDSIILAAAARSVPDALVRQLKPGGRIVLPLGSADDVQQLTVIEKSQDGDVSSRSILPVRFGALEVA